MSLILSGLTLDQNNQIGGVRGIWILGGTVTSYGPFTTPSLSANNPDTPGFQVPVEVGINLTSAALGITAIGGTGYWYYFANQKSTAKFDQTFHVSQENGTLYYEQALSCEFQHNDTTKDFVLQQLANNKYLKIVFEDANGQTFAMGFDRGAFVKTLTQTTGTKPGDMAGYKVVFSAEEINPAYTLQSELQAVLNAGAFAGATSGSTTADPRTNW